MSDDSFLENQYAVQVIDIVTHAEMDASHRSKVLSWVHSGMKNDESVSEKARSAGNKQGSGRLHFSGSRWQNYYAHEKLTEAFE